MATQPPQVCVQAAEFPAVPQKGPDGQGAAVPGQLQPPSPCGRLSTTCHPDRSERGMGALNPTLISYLRAPWKAAIQLLLSTYCRRLLHPKLCCGDTQLPSCSTPFHSSHVPLGYLDLSIQRRQGTCLYTNFILLRTSSEKYSMEQKVQLTSWDQSSLQQYIAAGQETVDMK